MKLVVSVHLIHTDGETMAVAVFLVYTVDSQVTCKASSMFQSSLGSEHRLGEQVPRFFQ